jgi:hypothetical protein
VSPSIRPADWQLFDPWWDVYAETQSIARSSTGPYVHGMCHWTSAWSDLDPWWETYAETGYETAIEIADLLVESNEQWEASAAPFDTDPLAADLTNERLQRGPLRPGREESWSRWLSRILQPSAALVRELFGVQVTESPSEVIREDQLEKEDGGHRRPDILLFHDDDGVSIEVKLNDENYQKTAETAALVERAYDDVTWTHTLLLPARKRGRLETIVSPSIGEDDTGQQYVAWDTPGPIGVVYWRDVTAAIRAVLRRGEVVDDQWAANAYLFCAVVEQERLQFQPQPVIRELANPTGVVDTLYPISIEGVLAEQLSYLQQQVES